MIVLIDSLAAVVLIAGWWVALSSYPQLPESIALHFDLSGEPDAWGGRRMIFLLPVVSTVIFVGEYALFRKAVAGGKMPGAMRLPLHLLLLELQVLFAGITFQISRIALGRARRLSAWFLLVVLSVIFGTTGWMLVAGKVR